MGFHQWLQLVNNFHDLNDILAISWQFLAVILCFLAVLLYFWPFRGIFKANFCLFFQFTGFPFENNIEARNTYKNDKYEYLKEDITHYKTQIVAFEIGARGYISRENRKRLKLIHKFCKTEIKIKEFEENIARLSINASYYIYLCRDQTEWVTPPLLSP